MPIAPTFYQVDAEQLARKQALANALMQQSMQPIDAPTYGSHNIPIPINPFSGLAKVAQVYAGSKMQNDVLDSQRKAALSRALMLGVNPEGSSDQSQTSNPTQSSSQTQPSSTQAPTSKWMNMYKNAIALGDQGMADYAKLNIEQMKPVALREGDLVQVDPNTGQAASLYQQPKMEPGVLPIRQNGQVVGAQGIPGYGTAAAGAKYPQEYAQAMLQPTEVKATAGPYMTNRAAASGAPNPFTGQAGNPGGIPLIGPKQEKELAVTGEYGGGLQKEIDESAANAIEAKARNQKMKQLLDTGEVSSGPLAKQVLFTGNLMKELGVPWKDPSSSQEYQKYALQGATQVAKQMFGARITQNEVNLMINSMPGNNLTEKANRAILQFVDMKNDRDIQKQTVFHQYKSQGNQLEDFNTFYNKNYPLQGISSGSVNSPSGQPSGKGYSHLWGG